MQDLASILEQIPHYWTEPGSKQASAGHKAAHARIQTFIFSATLTLPAALRKRLAKGAIVILVSVADEISGCACSAWTLQ